MLNVSGLTFITSNDHKFAEARELFQKNSLELNRVKQTVVEIQADTLDEVASFSLKKDPSLAGHDNIFLEDAGLFVNALGGFPGPYSAFVLKTLGCKGILKLMSGVKDRTARFESSIAFRDHDGMYHYFKGITPGSIALSERGTEWGFDPIFIPDGESRTYAELGIEKAKYNHRVKSLQKMIDYLNEKKHSR
ncbi:MAG: non-canonical purine NTP pyrophosphatase [Candidatus Hodarchaeales archaeon]